MSAPSPLTLQAMHQASSLLQAGHFAQARNVLEPLVRREPNFVEARRLLAGALQAVGDRAGAERELRAAAAVNPRWSPVLTALGELLVDDGRLDEAEATLRAAVANAAGYTRALLSLTRLLLRRGRAEQARALIAPRASLPSADVDTLTEFANAANASEHFDDAARAFERLIALQPGDAAVQARHAGALASANHFSSAAQSAQRALDKGADSAELWFIVATAAVGEDRFDDAERALREACLRKPDYADAQRELAQLLWMRTGDAVAATRELDAALRRFPTDQSLLTIKAAVLQGAGDAQGAFALLEDIAQGTDASPPLLLTASEAASKIGSPRALEYARRAARATPDNVNALGQLCGALLGEGHAEEVEQLTRDALRRRPDDQGIIALLTTALRMRGDPSYRAIADYTGLVHAWTIDTPDGWPSLPAYLADLAASLRRLHTLTTHPVYQSLRHGTQTTRNLTEVDDAAVRAFFKAIDGPIRRHIAAIGHGDDPTRRRTTGNYAIAGIWSVQLQPGGFHTDHVHPAGWLSSACYIDLPPNIATDRQGWLKFGEPGMPTRPALGAEHFIRPEPGLLALFPSHLWHGTVPFSGTGTRLTIAFDLVPA